MKWLGGLFMLFIKAIFNLTDVLWVRVIVYVALAKMYKGRLVRRTGEGLLYLSLEYVVSLHQGPIPYFDPWHYLVVSPILLVSALVIFNIPMLVVARSEELLLANLPQDVRFVARLSELLEEAGYIAETQAGFSDAIEDIETGCKYLTNAVGKARTSIYILTPNAVYFCVDEWLPTVQAQLKPPVKRTLEIIAEHARGFRANLIAFPGELHFILPDPEDEQVREYLVGRARLIGLPDEALVNANKAAVAGVTRLSAARIEIDVNMSTTLHLTPRSPPYRFMLIDNEESFLQSLSARDHGVLQPIHCIRNDEHPGWVKLVQLCLSSLVDFL